MRKHVIIVHGWKGNPDSNWQPWLREKLESRGVRVSVPELPGADEPNQEAWVGAIADAVGRPNKNTFFVTHSLGAMAALRYLEQLPKRARVGGLVMVAGFSEWNGRPESRDFFKTPLDGEKIRKTLLKVPFAIMSTDDPYVPFYRHIKILRDALKINLITMERAGHFNLNRYDDRWDKLPIAFSTLVALMS